MNGAVYFLSCTLSNSSLDRRIDFHAERLTWSFQRSLGKKSCPLFLVYSAKDVDFFHGRYCQGRSRALLVPSLRCFDSHCFSKRSNPWGKLDSQRTTDHFKYVIALALLELGHRVVFLDTDVWFQPGITIDRKRTHHQNARLASNRTFDIAIKSLSTRTVADFAQEPCESRSGFSGEPCGAGKVLFACICTCYMAFYPTKHSINFLRSVVRVLIAEPNLWEQDLVSKLLPIHVARGLELYDLSESFAVAHNITVFENGGYAHPNPFEEKSLFYHSGDKGHIPEGFCVSTNSSWCWQWGLLPLRSPSSTSVLKRLVALGHSTRGT